MIDKYMIYIAIKIQELRLLLMNIKNQSIK